MLPSTSSREALLACPPCPPWNLPSFTVESTLSTPCSRSDPPLSYQGAALAHLDSLSPFILFVLSLPPCSFLHLSSYLNLCGRSGRNCLLSPVLSNYNGSPDTYLSPLTSRIHSPLISDWRRTVSSKFFDTQVPSISTEELVLPRHARCVLSCLCCNGHSLLLGLYLSRIGRTENPFCSASGHSSQDTSWCGSTRFQLFDSRAKRTVVV